MMPITIEDDVFGPAPDGDGVNETVIVQAADLGAARSALQRAVGRYRQVDGRGAEHPEDDVAWHGVGGDAGRSCNYVSDIERHEALPNRAVMKGHRHRLVAASRSKLRAA